MADAEGAPLVIVKGMAGTAKTFYTLAVGLHAMLEQEEPAYRRILISCPNAQFDDDIGFLPGDESEKIAPLLRPIVDNLELLVDQNEKERFADERSLSGKVEELFDRGIVDAQALNFIRGRSISKTYLVIDEAQNLTPKQAKGIITRPRISPPVSSWVSRPASFLLGFLQFCCPSSGGDDILDKASNLLKLHAEASDEDDPMSAQMV